MAADRRDEIARLLRQRLSELRERDALRGPPAAQGPRPGGAGPRPANGPFSRPVRPPGGDFAARFADDAEVPDYAGLRDRLLSRHRGRSLGEALGGTPVNGATDLYEVVSRVPAPSCPEASSYVLEELSRSLWLVPGIRDGLATRLSAAGFRDLRCLCDHPRFGPHARRVCRLIDGRDPGRLMDHLAARASRGHPLALALSRLLDPGDLLFLDIETMGLFGGSPIVVSGMARVVGCHVELRQLVAASPAAEAGLVRRTAESVGNAAGLVTFNGRSFDLPYVALRAAFYGTPLVADPVHFDLLPHSRRAYRGQVPDCRLDTLARHVLGLDLGEDIPGSLVPSLYQDYLADPSGRAGLLAAIAEHNRADVLQMVDLFAALTGPRSPGGGP